MPALRTSHHSLVFQIIEPDGHPTGNRRAISDGMGRYFSVLGGRAAQVGARVDTCRRHPSAEILGSGRSALGKKRSFAPNQSDVRFAPNADIG
jgi:hypothetical protein